MFKEYVIPLLVIGFMVVYFETTWYSVESAELSSVSKFSKDEIYKIDQDRITYRSLIEESLVWRIKTIAFYKELNEFMKENQPFPQNIQNRIFDGSIYYINLRQQSLDYIDKYNYLQPDYELEFSLDKPSGKSIKTPRWFTEWYKHEVVLVTINPTDEFGQAFIMEMKAALAVALVLYDNFLVGIDPFQSDPQLRRKIDQDRKQVRGRLNEIADNYYAWGNRIIMEKALALFNREQSWMNSEDAKEFLSSGLGQKVINSEHRRYLDTLIKGSLSYENLSDLNWFQVYFNRARKRQRQRLDFYTLVKNEATGSISKGFGNLVGLVEFRKGKLFDNANVTQQVLKQLKPLDILLEKTPFRLTDTFIPGHWGHAAIWVGTPAELREIKKNGKSVWDSISPEFQEFVSNGHSVLEALRPGVMLNTLEHFMNIDDFGVMRRSESFSFSEEKKYYYLMLAFQQVGKDYDFNFDVNTDDKIVCSELIYKVYPDDNWPTENTLNRWTISPDNVAERAVVPEGGPYKYIVPILYTAGKQIEGDIESKRAVMHQLIKYSYDRIETYYRSK